jgi:hypothetical protein
MYDKKIKAMEEELTPFGFFDNGDTTEKSPLNF